MGLLSLLYNSHKVIWPYIAMAPSRLSIYKSAIEIHNSKNIRIVFSVSITQTQNFEFKVIETQLKNQSKQVELQLHILSFGWWKPSYITQFSLIQAPFYILILSRSQFHIFFSHLFLYINLLTFFKREYSYINYEYVWKGMKISLIFFQSWNSLLLGSWDEVDGGE